MAEAVSYKNRFLENYSQLLPQDSVYKLLHQNPLPCFSNREYRQSHRQLIESYLQHTKWHEDYSEALLSEYVTLLALDPLLKERNYQINLAPQNLEHGTKQRGVDLLIATPEYKIMLGLDVKLRRKNSDHDGGHWLDNLKAPYMNLSLGNWDSDVKKWLRGPVLDNFNQSGQIPNFNSFRQYLISRVNHNLDSQIDILNHPWDTNYTLPVTREDTIVYRQKLSGLKRIFSDIMLSSN